MKRMTETIGPQEKMMQVTRVATVAAVDGLMANFSLRDGRKRPNAAEDECESMNKE